MTRAPIPDLAPGERRLEGAVAHYLARVLRLRAGDAFVAFDPATAREADAVTVWTDQETITVRFGALREGRAHAARELTWIQGLAKGDKCDAVVRDATELGATRVIVAATRRIASEAARQCGRSDAPLVDAPRPWTDALAQAEEAGGDDGVRFCLWEQATDPLAPPLFEALSRGVPLAFACGPEGGLEGPEVDAARSRGWLVVSLGAFALRTETVAAAVLGAVQVWSGLV